LGLCLARSAGIARPHDNEYDYDDDDEMEALESEFDKLAKRQKSSMAKVSGVIDALLQQIASCKATHSNCKGTSSITR